MREVVIQSWCDVCAAQGDDIAADPFDLAWEGREYSLDLCEEHAAPIREFERLLETYGQQPSRRGKSPKERKNRDSAQTTAARQADGTYACPECGKTFNTPQGLGAHRYRRLDHRIKQATS